MSGSQQFAESAEMGSTRDPLVPAPTSSEVAYQEQVLNGLAPMASWQVPELCFLVELHAAGLRLSDLVARARLSNLGALAGPARLTILRTKFEELRDDSHPLKVALQGLQSLETIRIIESKA